jgi:ligand-binding sensor domain-containing protein
MLTPLLIHCRLSTFHALRNPSCLHRVLAPVLVLSLLVAPLLAVLLPSVAQAQLVPQRQWAVFRQTDGLLSNNVFSILVDDDAIWFGTNKGVNRYDGRWRSFPTSLFSRTAAQRRDAAPSGAITAMAKAVHGQGIWLGTSDGSIARWDGVKWQQVTILSAGIEAMADVDGVLWLATAKGLYLYDAGLVRSVPGLAGQAVHDIVTDGDVVWVGTSRGLWQLARGGTDLKRQTVVMADAMQLDELGITKLADVERRLTVPLTGAVEALWSDGAGSLWLGSGSTVVQFDPATGVGRSFEPFSQEGGEVAITAIAGTPGQRVWIASAGAGVVQYMFADGLLSAATNLGSSSEGGLDTDIVRALVIDGDNTLWFASPAGVFRYQLWAWLETDARLDSLVVNDMLYDHNGSLWVATGGEGVQRREGLYAHPTTFYPSETGLPSEFTNDLEQDSRGRVWAATAGGVAVYNNGAWSTPPPSVRLPSDTVKALKADDQGIWIGTSAGLAYLPHEAQQATVEPFFDGKAISRLARDSMGRIWAATQDGGLWIHGAGGDWHSAAELGGHAPEGAATALLPDPSVLGGMYVALMDAGIYRWTGEEWQNVDRRHWVRGDRVYALALDQPSGNLWIGSDIGLSRLDELSLVTYDSHDGMQNGAVRAIIADPQGGYWFGGQKGLSFYQQEVTPPWIEVSAINSLDGVKLADSWQVYAGRMVQASYTVGDVQSAPEELEVFYRLNRHGVAEPWRRAVDSPLSLRLETPDTVDLEMMVRDPSFNYSAPVIRRLAVVPPPSTISIPLLGELESRVFNLLMVFGVLAMIGFGYVSYEIFVHNHRVNEAIRRGFNPYISGEPVRREEMFYGRHELLQRIVATLHNNSIMIHGERRIGKTTLLYQLANALRHVQDEEYWFVPVLVDLEGTAEEQLFLQLIEDIYQTVLNLPDLSPGALQSLQILGFHRYMDAMASPSAGAPAAGAPSSWSGGSGQQAGGEAALHYTDREFGRDLRLVIRLLEQYGAQRDDRRHVRLILLLDEVDTLSQFNPLYQQQLRRIFMRDFAATLGAVVAGIAISKEWDRVESPWFNLFNEIAMAPFSYGEAIELLVEPVRGYYIYEPAALAFIVQKSDGRPYRIQQYALEAVNHMLKHKRRRIRMCDVEYAHEQILATTAAATSNPGISPPAGAAAEQKREVSLQSPATGMAA